MRCPACDGEDLSEETEHVSSEPTLRFRHWEPGVIQYKDLTVHTQRGRVCLRCGYIIVFASPEALEKLRRGRAT